MKGKKLGASCIIDKLLTKKDVIKMHGYLIDFSKFLNVIKQIKKLIIYTACINGLTFFLIFINFIGRG